MSQIMDAPYIREAEMYGMPPFEDNSAFEEEAENQAKELKKADKLTDQIVDVLLAVEDALLKFEEEYDDAVKLNKDIRDMIYRVEDIGCDIRLLEDRLNGGRG